MKKYLIVGATVIGLAVADVDVMSWHLAVPISDRNTPVMIIINGPVAQIPRCSSPISPQFTIIVIGNVHTCANFCYKREQCEVYALWDLCDGFMALSDDIHK